MTAVLLAVALVTRTVGVVALPWPEECPSPEAVERAASELLGYGGYDGLPRGLAGSGRAAHHAPVSVKH